MSEIMSKYEEQATKQTVLSLCVSLVREGFLTTAEAARRSHLTEAEFEEQMKMTENHPTNS